VVSIFNLERFFLLMLASSLRMISGLGLLLSLALTTSTQGHAKYFVLVVWDGMRPDYVSPELTPTLDGLRREGVWFANHHSVYPTSTEVNGTVLATGVFPQRSHIAANKEYRQEIDPLNAFPTQALKAVRLGDELSGGQYLAVPTVAERVQAGNMNTAVVGAKPVALLHDRLARGDESKNPVWFVDGCLPPSRLEGLTNRFGAFPAPVSPNVGRDQWATRCLTEAFWAGTPPRYSVLWLSEPDYSQHQHGPGSPEALASIRNCDQRLATVLQALDARGVRGETDVIVVSDHGFSMIGANCDMAENLRAAGINARSTWEQPPVANDVVVVGNGGSVLLYVVGKSPVEISKVVVALQQQPFTGAIFTRDALPGTFPLSEIKAAGPTAPDIIVATRWTRLPATDEHPQIKIFNDGYHEYSAGCGMHVTLSPTDLHNFCVAAGPDFRRGVADPLPSGNVDIVPTLLWLMNIKTEAPLDGRVLSEALVDEGPPLQNVKLERRDANAKLAGGKWQQYLMFTEFNGVRYLDEGNGQWTPAD
jgi:arylsulfatase A-like enzyme